jgi:hypothetical protein
MAQPPMTASTPVIIATVRILLAFIANASFIESIRRGVGRARRLRDR